MTSAVSRIRLAQFGLISVTGPDAAAFLQAQLTNSVSADKAVRAGWCTAKGRLIATLLVLPREDGFLLQLSADLAERVAKRLRMFVLRARVKVEDVSAAWRQWGLATDAPDLTAPPDALDVRQHSAGILVRLDRDRVLWLEPSTQPAVDSGVEDAAACMAWALADIGAGLPSVSAATTELFVPQMLNLERLGAIDFKKGCYPGQEIVARTQYRGELKRRMVRATLASEANAAPVPGQPVYSDDLPGQESGHIVNVARGTAEWALLVVAPVPTPGRNDTVRLAPDGPILAIAQDRGSA